MEHRIAKWQKYIRMTGRIVFLAYAIADFSMHLLYVYVCINGNNPSQ